MFRERGGSATFARHAFNELVSFIAGWAILIDYMIVIALAAISVPHYLTPISVGLRRAPAARSSIAGAVIALRRGAQRSPASPGARRQAHADGDRGRRGRCCWSR